jgi:hypothetical protein
MNPSEVTGIFYNFEISFYFIFLKYQGLRGGAINGTTSYTDDSQAKPRCHNPNEDFLSNMYIFCL